MSPPSELLDDIALLSLNQGRGGAGTRTAEPISIDYLRDLTPEDIHVINTVPLGAKAPALQQLRYSHHMCARLIASGKTIAEVAAITGRNVSRLHTMHSQDQAFRELVAHYKATLDHQFIDASGRLAVLGTTAVEILQERLEDKPDSLANRELNEIIEMAFDRSVAPPKGNKGLGSGQGSASGVTVNVTFVGAQPEASEAPLIEVTPTPQLEPPE